MMRSRDPQDPSTAQELGRLAQTEERLNALTLMTYADVGAVAPEAWTPVQDALLLELYSRTAGWMAGAGSQAAPSGVKSSGQKRTQGAASRSFASSVQSSGYSACSESQTGALHPGAAR